MTEEDDAEQTENDGEQTEGSEANEGLAGKTDLRNRRRAQRKRTEAKTEGIRRAAPTVFLPLGVSLRSRGLRGDQSRRIKSDYLGAVSEGDFEKKDF